MLYSINIWRGKHIITLILERFSLKDSMISVLFNGRISFEINFDWSPSFRFKTSRTVIQWETMMTWVLILLTAFGSTERSVSSSFEMMLKTKATTVSSLVVVFLRKKKLFLSCSLGIASLIRTASFSCFNIVVNRAGAEQSCRRRRARVEFIPLFVLSFWIRTIKLYNFFSFYKLVNSYNYLACFHCMFEVIVHFSVCRIQVNLVNNRFSVNK